MSGRRVISWLFLVTALALLTCCSGAAVRRESVQGSTPLVSFVLDDGNDTDYLVGKRIFSEQGAVACSAVTTGWIDTPNHLTPSQIRELRDAGWEIMSHTVSHPNLQSLNAAEVEEELARSKSTLEALGVSVANLVYPFNKSNELVWRIAARYYRSGRGGGNLVNSGALQPYFLKSFAIKHDLPRMEREIDRAYADKTWAIFYQHEIDTKMKLTDKKGSFTKGERVTLAPSGTVGRWVTTHWFPIFGYLGYVVPLSGVPQAGDTITGSSSGATARIDYMMYNELTQLLEMIRYIHQKYPDLRIVTIDQGLDLLGVPKLKQPKAAAGKAGASL